MGRTDKRIARLPRPSSRGSGTAPDDNVRSYLNEMDRYPLLTAEQERMLGARALAGDKAARRQLIESNLRLVVAIARTYRPRELTLLDLIGEGNIGLCQAVERYDPTRGARFATFAGWWIRQAISRGMAQRDNAITLPDYVYHARSRVRNAAARYEATNDGREPTDAELRLAAKVTPTVLERVRDADAVYEVRTLDAPVAGAHDNHRREEEQTTLGDLIPAPDEDGDLSEVICAHETEQELLDLLMTHCTLKEAVVLAKMARGDTEVVIGKSLGISRQRVWQIEKAALAKLRAVLAPEICNASVTPCNAPVTSAHVEYVQAPLFGAA